LSNTELIAGAIASVIGFTINIALWFFFKTESYAKEYKQENEKIVSRLVQEFKTSIDEWKGDLSDTPDQDLERLLPNLKRLENIAGTIEKWKSHMVNGKKCLKSFSKDMVIAGVGMAFGFGLLLVDDPFVRAYFIPAIFFAGLVYVVAYGQLKEYCRITNKIDEGVRDLEVGRLTLETMVPDKEKD